MTKKSDILYNIKTIWSKHSIPILSITGIVIVLTTFIIFSLTRNQDQAGANQTISSVSAPGGFPIPGPIEESSSSSNISSALSSSNLVSSISSSISSAFSTSISLSSSSSFISSSLATSTSSSNSAQSVQPLSSSSLSLNSSTNNSSNTISSISSTSSSALNSSINSSLQQNQSNSSQIFLSSSSNSNQLSSSRSLSTSSIVNFDPNDPGNFDNPSKGDPIVIEGENANVEYIPTTPRTGGPAILLIPFTFGLIIISYIYYNKAKKKNSLHTKEKKIK